MFKNRNNIPVFILQVANLITWQKKLLNLYRYQVEQVAANALRSSGINGYRAMGLAIFICVLYAISDEIHQLFMPGRGGQVKDVIIDSVGAIVGVLGYKIIRA